MTKRFCDKCGAETEEKVLLVTFVTSTAKEVSSLLATGTISLPMKPYDLCATCITAIKEALPG